MLILLLSLFVFLASFLLTMVVRKYAIRKAVIDIPNERSSHTIPRPRGGGIAIAVTWFTGISILYYMGEIEQNFYFALMSGVLVSVISIIDDIYGLKAFPRLAVQSLAAAIALYFLGGLKNIDFGYFAVDHGILLTALSFIAIVAFTNIYNFIDGIDGYAASEAVFITIASYMLINNSVFLILLFAVLGFLPWNWQKAKIFMGDVGSTLIGFTITNLAIHFLQSRNLYWHQTSHRRQHPYGLASLLNQYPSKQEQ